MIVKACARGHRYQGARCPECRRARDRARGTTAQRGYDGPYRRARLELIGQPCEIRLPGCTGIADTADHVIPVTKGGKHGPLRPACAYCNKSRGNREA